MGIFEIISAIVLILACVFIVAVVLMKDTKTQMSQTISGSTSDSYYQKNAGRTKEAMLNKATIAAAIVFFVLALAVNVINVYWGGSKNDNSSSTPTTPAVVSTPSDSDSDSSESTPESSADSESNSAAE
ncbi:MAG: preprotein translocase subunit SecG [Oscillospiraceae bacterium]|nr:preprotein translocase subunit SecG [Oscillospiraceae bacterium]